MEVSGEVADLLVKEGLEAAKIATELSATACICFLTTEQWYSSCW